jgi:hypothetical protein
MVEMDGRSGWSKRMVEIRPQRATHFMVLPHGLFSKELAIILLK